jgi:cobaltochelatase CobT
MGEPMVYSIYDSEHDEIIHARDLIATMTKDDPGYIDRMREAILPYLFKIDVPIEGMSPVTLLTDCSGSLRGRKAVSIVGGLISAGDRLHADGIPFEILGHTTRVWKGGKPYLKFVEERRGLKDADVSVMNSGRIGELRLIVMKDRDENWPECRDNMFVMLLEGILKENIDGEALQWAASRIEQRGDNGSLVVISDGHPCDVLTQSYNPEGYLLDHLREVIRGFEVSAMPMHSIIITDNKRTLSETPLKGEILSGASYHNTPEVDFKVMASAISRAILAVQAQTPAADFTA